MNKVYQLVTDAIIAKLEAGYIPWRKPWSGSASKNAPRNLNGRQYRGVNIFLLSMQGYSSPFFATYNQIQEKGGYVKKGEQGHMVVFYGSHEVEDRETGKEKVIPFLRYYKVFNVSQCEGIEIPEQTEEEEKIFVPIESAESIVAGMPQCPEIRHGQQRAYYSPSLDYVNMPQKESFDTPEDYFNTLFHELAHATGHISRLSRKGVTESAYFGSHEYSKEELVAEMGAAFLSAEAGIETTIHNSAAYIQSWLRALKSDKTMLVSAASQAQKAADFILCRKPEELQAAA